MINAALTMSKVSGAITPSDTVDGQAGRTFVVVCTVAGNVKVGLSGGAGTHTLTIPVAVGLTTLPWEVSRVYVTGTTATATYTNLE